MKRFLCLLAATLTVITTMAQNEVPLIEAPRPKVGVVLGGGGAKGAAHIGVLKYIEELGIPIDYVAGTSMGSIIGGLYAIGYSPDELQELISQMDWSSYVGNTINRSNLSSTNKMMRSTFQFSLPFDDGALWKTLANEKKKDSVNRTSRPSLTPSLPSSYVASSNLLNLFNSLSIGYQDEMDFNDLPIPFACIATNAATGEQVVLRQGKFPNAIRASMAIPGVFSPVEIDGKLLIDGGLVNNFPADVCREMGADIIIGVEVSDSMVSDIHELQSLPNLLGQLVNIAVMGHNEANRQLCDIYMHPDITGYGTMSFKPEAIDTLVRRGYKEAKIFHNQLLAVKQHLEGYGVHGKQLHAPKAHHIGTDSICLSSISMTNATPKEASWLLRKGQLVTGKPIPTSDIQRAIDNYRGTGVFTKVEYSLKPAEHYVDTTAYDAYDLHLDLKTSQPHCVNLGLRYDSEESASVFLNLGYNQKKLSGLKFNLNGILGYNIMVNPSITYAELSLANFNVSYILDINRYNLLNNEGSLNVTRFTLNRFQAYISEFHLRQFDVAVGFEIESYAFHQKPEQTIFNEVSNDMVRNRSYGPYAKIVFDNMDQAYFARKGSTAALETHLRLHKNREDDVDNGNFTEIGFAYKTHLSTGRFTFVPQFYSRFLLGHNRLIAYKNIIGGSMAGRYYDFQMPFVGIDNTYNTNDITTIARLDLRYNFYRRNYISAIFNYMHHATDFIAFVNANKSGDRFGCALQYAYNSPFGPITFDLHWSDLTKSVGAFFSIGYDF